ncbi:MAG: hypothetical protein ABIE03_04720 [Patescibacteria group bacterium]|nr:hypothetical protein [Patescibacteria group bacterium]
MEDQKPSYEMLEQNFTVERLVTRTRIKVLYFAAVAAYRYQLRRLGAVDVAEDAVISMEQVRVKNFLRATLDLSAGNNGFNQIKIDFNPVRFYPEYGGGMRSGLEGNEFGVLVMIWRYSMAIGFADYYKYLEDTTAINYLKEALSIRKIVEVVVNSRPGQALLQFTFDISDIFGQIPGTDETGISYLLHVQRDLERSLYGKETPAPHWSEQYW